jgi:uncharacterized protein (DUF2237 family)
LLLAALACTPQPAPSQTQTAAVTPCEREDDARCAGLTRAATPPEETPMTTQDPTAREASRNVLGTRLEPCSLDPLTGFYRDGCCETGPQDTGRHVVCAQVTEAFLNFSRSRGNDLITPRPDYRFPGLKPGDRWCLCASRWREALDAGLAPPIYLKSTHEAALRYVTLEQLHAHALDLE